MSLRYRRDWKEESLVKLSGNLINREGEAPPEPFLRAFWFGRSLTLNAIYFVSRRR